ncbi:uncharacterized protein ASPGLDRAFT_35205 [Aspergillus glaucus CBS 516.65]|uniref:Activator of Hsp90 ATPase homologue 1/2-like C-terminal domain-containing protein n=1 Tax=Aspergillus glaucus CBS 516.65 TaxID=1160497 RepID=A0A1L9VLD6_ASPGL|nr:hypothetical protein ASPGLDRAFT_35205 [Aspergillus glaucus CBS 516.65]OJJ84733.1 hypothetical protein ASPGLDRAFT_35205 [Aspergillus glaucus CBS 516.65]
MVPISGNGRSDLEGTVIESTPPSHLAFTWTVPGEKRPYGPTAVKMAFFGHESLVRLTLVHDNFADERERDLTAEGWAAVLSNLKTYLETGRPLLEAPWRVPKS